MIDELLDFEIEEIDSIQGDERLPSLVREWVTTFGQVSRHNEYAATLSYFCLLGQVLKDYVRIPFGYSVEDSRIHVCWIQTARSGKSVLNDFYTQITDKTFNYINAQPGVNSEFDIFDVVDYTDAALIGTTERVPNPNYEPGGDEPKEIEQQVFGALEGSGLALFDEFESSGVFKRSTHKENVITYFQKLMNTLTTDGYKIKKKLAHGPTITCDCQRSMFATTYPPEHLTEVIAEKGVLQRMFMYIRDVPQHVLNQMRRELIASIGQVRERATPANKFSKALLTIHNIVKERHDAGISQNEIVSFSDGVTDSINLEYDNMIAYLSKVPSEAQKIVSLFETNSLIYITKFAVLCAITESIDRVDNEKWIVFPRNVRQAAWIVRQGYMSQVAWLLAALRLRRVEVADKAGFEDYIAGFNACDKTDDGWVNKAQLRIECEQNHNIPQAKFYRAWSKIAHKFDEKKEGRTTLVKIKGDED
jgi:hypothetical protein